MTAYDIQVTGGIAVEFAVGGGFGVSWNFLP
jgi:hypothetical protein